MSDKPTSERPCDGVQAQQVGRRVLCIETSHNGAAGGPFEVGLLVWDIDHHKTLESWTGWIADPPTAPLPAFTHQIDIRLLQRVQRLGESALAVASFDALRTRKLIEDWFGRYHLPGLGAPWIDMRWDPPYPREIKSRKAKGLADHHHLPAADPIWAGARGLLSAQLLSRYPIEQTLAAATEPWVVVKAEVSYEQRAAAQALGFNWQRAASREYPKSWVKSIRESRLEKLRQKATFSVSIIERVNTL